VLATGRARLVPICADDGVASGGLAFTKALANEAALAAFA